MAKQSKQLSHPFLKIDQSYVNKNGEFPDRTIDPASKGDNYCMEWSKGIYSHFVNDKTSWGVSAFDRMNQMRLYAMADQPISSIRRCCWMMTMIVRV